MKLDDRVTWALILAVVLQAVGALLWAGAAAQRLDAVEEKVAAQSPVAERLARLETGMADARASLIRIEARLDRSER